MNEAPAPAVRAGDPRRFHEVLDATLAGLREQPSRTWSIIITIYGDAIVPRGGSVWLGTLLSFFRAMDVAEGVVRTAMSRLASDGWLERSKSGRNSFYRLAEKGSATFAHATQHIYFPRPSLWDGRLDLIVTAGSTDREAVRGALQSAGFGSPAPGLWVGPPGEEIPAAAANELKLKASGDTAELSALAARSWPLQAIGEAYRRFVAAFAPMRTALAGGAVPTDLDALVARVLLIHEYRRVVLRDPLLPAAILPEHWPAEEARLLCGELYRALLQPSERWLDAHALGEDGEPLKPASDINKRFAA
ncbi:phenylacetic acid degradation operon negative regulatory protein PaaX [Mesorhizobium sp. L-8-3]|uniref:phenylacetic acid degradation operon negative regulatory protein PaaX n=1 Tax=Mesorhizobium sp. L-8-3 TaxID=2744522 RepID=UPI00192721E6|nr:phenylacetic acid degradation operon negative regulatory protein PaaX [Mesorhizobium sp. L-8-3]